MDAAPPESKMKLTVIPFAQVQADINTGATTLFNTSFHTADEAPELPIPLDTPTHFARWLPLILRSRGLSPSALQTVHFTRAQATVLLRAAAASVHTRVLNRAWAEDLRDDVHPALGGLSFPPEGLFARLSACSPKDGAPAGAAPLHSVDDLVLRLTTSLRTANTLRGFLASPREAEPLFLLPYDARMAAEREFRVFCPPPTLRVAAVSQYRWHKPWTIGADRDGGQLDAVAAQILRGVEEVRAEILAELRETGTDDLDDALREQGFTFDVLYDEGRELCVLVELNSFGVRSACGSCLFQWLRDREVMYGKLDEVEFRVTF
jgi:hypothetical protein